MVHAPLRGVLMLGRLAFVVAAAAAVPVLLKKGKPFFDKAGDALVELGNKLKEGDKPKAEEPQSRAKAEPKAATKEPQATKTATATAPKKAPATAKQTKPKAVGVKRATAKKKPPVQ